MYLLYAVKPQSEPWQAHMYTVKGYFLAHWH